MAKYAAIPRLGSEDDFYIGLNGQTVYVSDDPKPTGLLDIRGNEIYRMPDQEPAGFCLKARCRS